ncbi:hypothetical protein [Streptomyces sp. NPDC021224]|uniref:hypothetical protein n=1 Tax=unclassified Streptomyces TaxID=2593676 RepID=UPI0037909471
MRPAGPVRLTAEETEDAFHLLDPAAVTYEALTAAERGGDGTPLLRVRPAADELLLSGRLLSPGVALPASGVLRLWRACLCAAAARALTVPGVVTAGLVGPAAADRAYPALLGRALPDLTHVALYDGGAVRAPRGSAARGAGAAQTRAADVREALFGADLVILTSHGDTVAYDWLSRGAVLVNATGRRLARTLYERADRLVVDDARQRPARMPAPALACLGDVLSGPLPVRRPAGETVLVDLYGLGTYNRWFTVELCRAALACGLGRPRRD